MTLTRGTPCICQSPVINFSSFAEREPYLELHIRRSIFRCCLPISDWRSFSCWKRHITFQKKWSRLVKWKYETASYADPRLQNSAQSTLSVASYDVVGFISCRKSCGGTWNLFSRGTERKLCYRRCQSFAELFRKTDDLRLLQEFLSKQNHCSRVWYFVSAAWYSCVFLREVMQSTKNTPVWDLRFS